MKKSIIISAIVLGFSLVSVNAKSIVPVVNQNNIETVFNVNSFCISIVKGDIETVKKLLIRGEDINQKSNGMTPIMYAAKYNRVEILKLLIEKGRNIKNKIKQRIFCFRLC